MSMWEKIKKYLEGQSNRILLIGLNIVFGIVFIALSNCAVLPLGDVNFFFFSFVVFLGALYRPGWVFLFLVGMLPYETVSFAPEAFGITLRPYQWLAALLALALAARLAAKKLLFKLFEWRWFDTLLLLLPLGGILSAVNAPVPTLALKQALIVLSFLLIYFLGRVFFQSEKDVRQALPFLVSSSLVVFGYALWQNVRFLSGAQSFEVMAGRPNSTFSEADWLGMFVLFVLGILYAFLFPLISEFAEKVKSPRLPARQEKSKVRNAIQNSKFLFLLTFLILTFVILIITVARSAWLGAAAITVVSCLGIFLAQGTGNIKSTLPSAFTFGLTVFVSCVVALGLVTSLHLTSFQLFNRVQSTASGLQKITVACEQDMVLPETIATTDELMPLHCEHIDLEDIETKRQTGYFVKEIFRDDPNVSIRKDIYGKTGELIEKHPLLGIGWGSVAVLLGTDERPARIATQSVAGGGAGLNASNMFLEIWLGSGLIGLIAFSLVWFGIAIAAVRRFFRGSESDSLFPLFILSVWAGITVFNMFNAGILLGFFFMYLALGALLLETRNEI